MQHLFSAPALPLPAGSLVWPNITATNCDFDCLVDACRSGCKDLESLNSTCDVRCNTIGDGSAACHQGCRAVADLFLHQLQQLVELVSVEAFLDAGLGLGLNWSFADQQATVMQEISTTSIRWLALSRAVDTTMGWRWTPMENNAFREPNLQLHATVFVPMEQHNDLELQLVALWRDIAVVSRPFQQTVLLPLGTTTASTVPRRRLKPTADNGAQLQLAPNGFVACWRTEERVSTDLHEAAQFRLRLFAIADDGTGTLVRALHTNSTCHFFRNLPDQHQQFQLGIADVGTTETTVTAQIPTPMTTAIATTTPTMPSSTTMGAAADGLVLNSSNKIAFDEDELVLNITLQQVHDGSAGRPNADAMVTLLFSDGTGLYILDKLDDFVMLSEPSKVPFALNSSQSITALACLSETELLVGLSDGAMYRLNIGEWLRHFIGSNNVSPSNDHHHQQQFINNTISPQNADQFVHAERIKAADGVPITQIVVSEITERIYAVRDKLGIMRCHFHTCENATVLTLTNSPNFIYRLAEDAWNGFLYYATTTGDVFTTPMLPLDASQNYSLSITRRLAELPAVNSLEVDLAEQKLIAISRTGQLISRDLINSTVRDEREGWTLSDAYRNVVRAQFYRNRLFWTSSSCGDSHPWESCLFSEEFDHANKAVHLSKYLYPGPVKEFVLLKPFSAPPFMVPPSKVGLIMLTDSDALLSWRPPTSLPFQAIGSAWRALSYEYVLHFIPDRITTGDKNDTVQTSTTVSQGVIPTTHITVPVGAEPVEGLYNLTIRACTRNICSAPVISSTRPLHADRMYKSITLYVKKGPLLLSENAIGTTAGINGDPFLLLNMMGAELPADRLHLYPKLPPADVGIVSLAFDNSSGILYQSWQRVFTVTRSFDPITTVTPLSAHFLDSVHFHAMALLVSRATVLFASSYTVFAYRSTSSFYKIVYNCQPWSTVGGEECGKVYGIATEEDHPTRGPGRVFLLTMLSSGAVQLLSCSSDLAQPFQLIATANHFPYKIRQMAFADDRLLILTDDGFFGTIDMTLQMINLNFAVRDIQFLLASDNVEDVGGDHRIHFEGPIQFDDKLGQFSWTVSSWQNTGGHHEASSSLVTEAGPTSSAPAGVPMLYKLSLYREAFGGERIVLLSQSGTYQLPQRLTQAWNSRQKFDLVLEAFNAWSAVALNRSALLTPTKPPSAPRNVRIYATQHRTVDGTRAIIDLFWDEPKEWNGDQLGYTVNCTIVATVPAGQQQGTSDVQSVNATLRRGTNRAYTFSVRSGKISCLIFAMNDQRLVGPPSSPAAEIDGSEFKPLIRLFAIDSTDNLVAIQNWTIESVVKPSGSSKARFLAKNRKRRQIAHTIQYQAMTYVGGELYAIRKEPEMSQLALVKLDINQVDTVLFKASLLGEFSQIDAMAADWVANRLLLVSKRELMTIHLDQLQDSPSTVLLKKLFQLSLGAQDAKQLVFDPFTNTAYLLTKNGSLFSLDLNKGIESNLELTTSCLRQKTITSIVGEFIWNKAASPQLYALTWNGLIELKLNSDNNCPDINVNWSLFGESGLKAISLFTVADKVLVFATPTDLLVYDRQAAAVSQFPSPSPPIRQLLAVSQSSQPFPDRYCFQLPPTNQINFNVKNEGRTGAVVEVHELQQKDAAQQLQQPNECVNVSQPITQYDVHFRKRGTDKHQQEKIKNVHSSSNRIVVDNGVLEKYTDYDVTVSWLNHYCPVQGQSEAKPLHTGFGYPSAPKDPKALALTPDTVLLSWTLPDLLSAPAAEIRYRISQQSPTVANPVPVAVRPAEGTGGHFSTALAEVVPCEANPCLAKVPNLRPSTDYHFWVVALHINRLNADDPEATSVESQAHTRDIPGTLRLENVTSDSMFLRWNTLMAGVDVSSSQLVQISIQYRQSGVDASWTDVRNSTFSLTDLPQRFVYVDQLHPATAYDYRYAAEYTTIFDGIGTMPAATSGAGGGAQQQQQAVPSGDAKEAQQQQQRDSKKSMLAETFYQQSQQARTKAGTPSAPLDVKLNNEQCYSNDVTTKQPPQQPQQQTDWTTMTTPPTTTMKCEAGWTVRWSEPNFDGGEPIQNYAVEYRADTQTEWEIAERGLPPDRLFWRVAWAETHSRRGKTPSDEELVQGQFRVRAANAEGFGDFGYTPLSDKSASGGGPGGISFWLFILMILFSLMLFSCCIACGYCKDAQNTVAERRRIREKLHKPICLESIGQQIQFPQSSHKFSQEVLNELKTLPRLNPESVKATKELGMGSFGRVCEGLMLTNNIPPTSVRVAIKYLKDNCEENRVKFLKEAILMKNFDHPNIVKLLGVSMEGEQFLVLELMDGGDMRNFLQKSRPHRTRPSRVSLRELIAMIVDVGRGCVYLEKYKHVHRDLAARNCLISSATSLQRVTKIADFGHARELFVDDYYRFRGGDLLPLRWLSPEVINQGLFTSKSDMWAFGVLLWEIVTLGEQPYSQMSNAQVLARLSSGMALDRPPDCPNELYDVMKQAWTVCTEKRPQFSDIQPRLETMRGLPAFQSRDPFPPSSLCGDNSFFDASQNSSTSKGEQSSTTTTTNGDGEESYTTACQFDKSGESFSVRRNAKRSRRKMPSRSSVEASTGGGGIGGGGGGGPSASYSFGTASTGVDSSEYEVPRSGAQLMMTLPGSRPLNHRRSATTGFHQNDAFVADSSVDESANGGTGGDQQRFTRSISLAGTSRAAADEPLTTPFRQFGASSSRISRV
ncbi:hypothetical protein niasHS_008886 [Heterodera schachtii]|uniref:receptor protein-tyrosine kinase n=1 Tax=Heterodera schachtii TaxID=97005 RepID=A0ABD2IVR8_HETSC